MLPSPYQVRSRIRKALCHLGRQQGTVYRLDRDQYGGLLDTRTEIGHVAGYPYSKARTMANIVIALPGQIDEGNQNTEHLLVLYATGAGQELGPYDYEPPDTQKDDVLVMKNGTEYRVIAARDTFGGAYQVYQLGAM